MRSTKPTILPRIQRQNGGSPYTYAYESLNGNGSGIGRTLWNWRKALFGISLFSIILWMGMGWWGGEEHLTSDEGFNFPVPHPPSPNPLNTRPPPSISEHPSPPQPPKPPSKNRPVLSYETDSDPLSTTLCSTPHPSLQSKPLVQWALIIDAGSTGSRIHVYKFNNCGPSPEYEYEVFKQTRPGLSSYASSPNEAAKSLDVLMKEAEKVVPRSVWSCTPVVVKATAGLRLLGEEEAHAILQAVEYRLKEKYRFMVPQVGGVEIMDGKDEGVYAWITGNYLLGGLPHSAESQYDNPDSPTGGSDEERVIPYAVLDLGGASTQIVFRPSFDLNSNGIPDHEEPDNLELVGLEGGLEDGEHKYILKFEGRDFVLYQHSYLGYGLMRARGRVHRVVEFMNSFLHPATRLGHDDDETIYNPCIARGMKRRIEVDIGRDGVARTKNVTMAGADVGNWEACNRVLELVLAKDAICHLKPCSFNGVYQPSLLDSFPTGPVLLLSYFYDRIAPLLAPPSSSPKVDPTEDLIFPISLIRDLAKSVCAGEETWRSTSYPFPSADANHSSNSNIPLKWGDVSSLMEELRGRPEYCLDLSFMYSLLRLGYEFGEERGVRVGKQVRGTELGWALGAGLGVLGVGQWECRA